MGQELEKANDNFKTNYIKFFVFTHNLKKLRSVKSGVILAFLWCYHLWNREEEWEHLMVALWRGEPLYVVQ